MKRRLKKPAYKLTDKGADLAKQARKLMQAMERGDMDRFVKLAEESPDLSAIFEQNDQQTAVGIIAMLLDMGHKKGQGPTLLSEELRPGSWTDALLANYQRVAKQN